MNNKTIILCLDIDETLMNSRTRPISLVDFNGSDDYDDASEWCHFLEDLHNYCQAKGFLLIVQIISAKQNALPDSTVDQVMRHLGRFLPLLDKYGDPIAVDLPKGQYLIRRHLKNNSQQDISTTIGGNIADINMAFNVADMLPSIHLCSGNKPGTLISSKAWVMKSIREHFQNAIPSLNMFLLDNSLFQLADVTLGSEGALPCFQAVSAARLEDDTSSSHEAKLKRTKICWEILDDCKQRIASRMDYLIGLEKKTQAESYSTPFPVLPPLSYIRRMVNANLYFKPNKKSVSSETFQTQKTDEVVSSMECLK